MKRTESYMTYSKSDGMLIKKRLCTLEQNLRTLLSKNPYTFKEAFQRDSPPGLYRLDDLKSSLHATDEELNSALRLVSALEINGYWRVVDDGCISEWIYYLLLETRYKKWSLNSLDGNRVVTILEVKWGFPPELSRNCLKQYARTTDGMVFVFDTKLAYVKLAQVLVQQFGGEVEIRDFMHNLSNVGMPVNLDLLEDQVLVHKDGDQAWVYLPSDHNKPNSISLKSAVQAFFSNGPHNLSGFHMPMMTNIESSVNLDPLEDAGTMEQKLEALLQNPDIGLCGWDDLKNMLDATDEDLKSTLSLVSAVEIDGYWRILDDLIIDMDIWCYTILYWKQNLTTGLSAHLMEISLLKL